MNSTIFQILLILCVVLGISGCVGGAAYQNDAWFAAGGYAWFCLLGLCFFFNTKKSK